MLATVSLSADVACASVDNASAVCSVMSCCTLLTYPVLPVSACISLSLRAAAVKMSLNVGQARDSRIRRFHALHSSLYSPVENMLINALVVICVFVNPQLSASANSAADSIFSK